MTHPLDLHPLHEVASAAWNEIRKENQPVYAELPVAFKSDLLDTAARVESGDPNVVFECRVAEKLAAKAEALARVTEEAQPVRLEPMAEAPLGTFTVEEKGRKTSATVNVISEPKGRKEKGRV